MQNKVLLKVVILLVSFEVVIFIALCFRAIRLIMKPYGICFVKLISRSHQRA